MTTATLTIDLDAIASNWRALDQLSNDRVETAAVVKANGYGLGVENIAKALVQSGVRTFFVANAEEGVDLRHAIGPGFVINIFSGHMSGDGEMIHDMQLVPMLNSMDQLTRHLESLPGHAFGIQLDTGMNRLGFEPAEWLAIKDIVLAANPSLILSHLACGDEPGHPMNAQQLDLFEQLTQGLTIPRSLSATGGILLGLEYHFDMTRPGIGLYGGLPFDAAIPVTRLQIPIIQTRDLEVGESVGYSNTWIATQPSRIATLAAGYADGLFRTLSDNAVLYMGDIPCPLVGRVSMDMITVDITHLTERPNALDLLCADQTVDQLATAAGTIGYEILTSLGARFTRRYTGIGS